MDQRHSFFNSDVFRFWKLLKSWSVPDCLIAKIRSVPLLLPLHRDNYPFFLHTAPGPRPWQTKAPAACCSRSTRRTMSRLTPGHNCSSSLIVNPLPGMAVNRSIFARTSSRNATDFMQGIQNLAFLHKQILIKPLIARSVITASRRRFY